MLSLDNISLECEERNHKSQDVDPEIMKETLQLPVEAEPVVPSSSAAGTESQMSSAGNSELCMQEIVSPFR